MGKLTLVLGCMFASKSTYILNSIQRYRAINKKIFIVSHILDKQRTLNKNTIKTHDNNFLPALLIESLDGLEKNIDYINSDIIVIDEAQFFPDLLKWVTIQVDKTDKFFIISGLQSDFQRNKIGQVIDLIPQCEDIIHVKAFCKYCENGNLATFTKRESTNYDKILVGDTDCYVAVCRKHFLE
jgi:thymidine kinase